MPTKRDTVKIEIRLSLPDSVAREAEACGLLEPGSLEAMLRGELRRRRVDRLFEAADRLAALSELPLTEQEVEVEVQAACQETKATGEARGFLRLAGAVSGPEDLSSRCKAVRELSSFHLPVSDPEDLERGSVPERS